ncbi:hypothetical protein LTR95_016105 [Oleoguttula sp. CCFEE 5521]
MAPTARPSPRRFLPPNAASTRQKSPTKQTKTDARPPPAVQDVDPDLLSAQPVQARPATAMPPPPPARPATARYVAPREAPAVSTSQFVQPPRFSTRRAVMKSAAPSSPPRLPFATPRLPGEDVEEAPPDSNDEPRARLGRNDDDEEMLLDAYESSDAEPGLHAMDVLPTIETAAQHEATLPFSPAKRRRLSPPSHFPFAAIHAPRFATPALSTPAPQTSRPAFIPPATAAAAEDASIPPLFSPHRRGAKFVPGGLAATVQSWVVETGQQAAASRRSAGRYGDVEGELGVRVREVEEGGGGVVRIRGCKEMYGDRKGDVRVLLVGSEGRGRVEVGSAVRVKMPWWEVQIEGEAWVVGVEWKVA